MSMAVFTAAYTVIIVSRIVLYQVNIDGCRVHPVGRDKAQPADNGLKSLRLAATLPRPSAIAPALLSTLAPASFYLVHPWTRTTYIPVGVLLLITYIPVATPRWPIEWAPFRQADINLIEY